MKKIERLKFEHGEAMNDSEMKQITGGESVWWCYYRDWNTGFSYSTQDSCTYSCSNKYPSGGWACKQ